MEGRQRKRRPDIYMQIQQTEIQTLRTREGRGEPVLTMSNSMAIIMTNYRNADCKPSKTLIKMFSL